MFNIIKRTAIFIQKFLQQIMFLALVIIKYRGKTQQEEKKGGKLAILASGPSFKEELKEFKPNDFSEIMVMNFFAFDEIYEEIKPKSYGLVDPAFFKKTSRIDSVIKLYKDLNKKTTWDLTLYIPYYYSKEFKEFALIDNAKIKTVVVNNCPYYGFERYRNYFYKLGYSCPQIYTVLTFCIYIGVKSRFDCIELYGVDQSYFTGLFVNKNNELCLKLEHFYKEEVYEEKPLLILDTGEVMKIAQYVLERGKIFESFDFLKRFADYMGVKIINCTKNSLIDSYERKHK